MIKNIKLSFTIPQEYPDDWTDAEIISFTTQSSSCADNLLDDIKEFLIKNNDCACSIVEAEIVDKMPPLLQIGAQEFQLKS